MSKTTEYVLLFVLTGLSAVIMKYLADHNSARWAGIVGTFPIRVSIGLFIFAGAAGTVGFKKGSSGIVIGMVAIAVMLTLTHLLVDTIGTRGALFAGLAGWLTTALGLGYLLGD